MPSMALAAPSVLATDAGETVVGLGGTAADAAVVMALVAMCTEPGVCAPGAGGFVTVDPAAGPAPVVVDGYMAIPGIGFAGETDLTRVTMAYGGGVTTDVGPGSIAVPGSFAALSVVHERFGRVPWVELLEVVASLVEGGFPLSKACRTYLVDSGSLIFEKDPATREGLFDGDRLKDRGDPIRFAGMADSLRQIGAEGARTFYEGDLAARIVSDLESRGSSLTLDDLRRYEPVLREPLQAEIAGWTVTANPPPAVGGMSVLGAVQQIARSADPMSASVWKEALVEVLHLRKEYESSSDHQQGASELLRRVGVKAPSTITVAAVDDEGTSVAATFSAGYGSGVIPAGTGLLMNNSLGEIELLASGFGELQPGERMLSNMAPTAARSDRDVIAIGSPGADRITSALTITLVRFLLSDDTLPEAIEHPRLHPESVDPVEIAAEIGLGLESDDPIRWYPEPHMFFGGVNSAGMIGGQLVSHADSRRVGSAKVV